MQMRILVANPNDGFCELIRDILSPGFVDWSISGQGAARLLTRRMTGGIPHHIVIADVRILDDILRQLAITRGNTAQVLVTSGVGKPFWWQGPYLDVPFRHIDELREMVRGMIEARTIAA